MFTGIIEEKGTILEKHIQEGCKWRIKASFAPELGLGDSVSINGVCHTVTDFDHNSFQVFSSKETMTITALKQIQIKDRVNLERALRLGSRLDGHFVYGHIDSTTKLLNISESKESSLYTFELKSNLSPYLITKGSIAIDGISLTIYQKGLSSFSVMLIPHTLAHTTFKSLKLGQRVNIELDILGKYLENFKHKKTC